ncbi:hypothetical protein WJX74_006226 [Apatococcus lobatus]|uniref:Uncharacterized protein n=1 Tax=Apatococcus lobatus TaxID=904363 RepID=A0AAW1RYA2_9CHLO
MFASQRLRYLPGTLGWACCSDLLLEPICNQSTQENFINDTQVETTQEWPLSTPRLLRRLPRRLLSA